MRILTAALCFGAAVGLAVPSVQGLGIPAKQKGKKVQGDLVPAYAPADTGSGTGDDELDSPALLDTPVLRSSADPMGNNCTFLAGKFKYQVGKDTKIKLKGVECNGTPYTGTLCAHSKVLSTIMNEEIDKKGNVTSVECKAPSGTNTENTVQFVTSSVGTLNCTAGKCDGLLPPVTDDPCPDVDKVTEVRRVEVFDGPDLGSTTYEGATIGACCGPHQTVAGNLPVSAFAPCNAPSHQDVMAEMGVIVEGVQ